MVVHLPRRPKIPVVLVLCRRVQRRKRTAPCLGCLVCSKCHLDTKHTIMAQDTRSDLCPGSPSMAALTIDDGPSLSPATSAKRNPYQNIASTTRNSFEDQSKDTREPHTLVTTSTWHQHHAEEAATHNSPPKKRKPPPPASK